MPIARCACGREYKVKSSAIGRTVVCKACGSKFQLSVSHRSTPESGRSQQESDNDKSNGEGHIKTIGWVVALVVLVTFVGVSIWRTQDRLAVEAQARQEAEKKESEVRLKPPALADLPALPWRTGHAAFHSLVDRIEKVRAAGGNEYQLVNDHLTAQAMGQSFPLQYPPFQIIRSYEENFFGRPMNFVTDDFGTHVTWGEQVRWDAKLVGFDGHEIKLDLSETWEYPTDYSRKIYPADYRLGCFAKDTFDEWKDVVPGETITVAGQFEASFLMIKKDRANTWAVLFRITNVRPLSESRAAGETRPPDAEIEVPEAPDDASQEPPTS